MQTVDIGSKKNNPHTHYQVVFGRNVSADQILNSLKTIAEMRQEFGLTTREETRETLQEASEKIAALDITHTERDTQ